MAGTFLEQFLDSVKALPADVVRELQLLQMLDQEAKKLRDKLQTMRQATIQAAKDNPGAEVIDKLREVRETEKQLSKMNEEKIAVATDIRATVSYSSRHFVVRIFFYILMLILLQIVSYCKKLNEDLKLFKNVLPDEDNLDPRLYDEIPSALLSDSET